MDKFQVLERYFGYSSFRPGQEKLIDGILSGRDVFGIMPTGGGKSLCYQVPALLLPGVTLVVSPLISLMRDQVMALKEAGVPAAFINSSLSGQQVQAVYRNMLEERYKIVYVAPERLDYPGFSSVVQKMHIPFVAVDEAHCISQWGQDFRPSYLRIVDFVDGLPRRPVLGAFTATATKQVRLDTERILRLKDPIRTVTGFDRPNLYFGVLKPDMKDPQLLKLLRSRKEQSGIVYCSTRKKVEAVCELLRDAGFSATRYHAGLDEKERAANQEDFLYDRKNVMVATNAFGMGIDKSNVNYVIHYNMPKSLEAYYQEAGRAGRDGSRADCILLYSHADVSLARYLIENSADNEELTPRQQAQVRQQDLARLKAMEGFCTTETCLRGYILEYFGQRHPEICGNCSNCKGEFDKVEITQEAQMVLSCVRRIYDKVGCCVGMANLAKVLRGSRDRNILQLKLDTISTYGLLNQKTRTEIHTLIIFLESEGYLRTDPDTQALLLTAKASEVLFRKKQVFMLVPKEEPEQGGEEQNLSEEQQDLLEALKALRKSIAMSKHIPAFTVFSNATLEEMAKKQPKNLSEFRKISGVGEIKCSWYGKEFLPVIKNFKNME